MHSYGKRRKDERHSSSSAKSKKLQQTQDQVNEIIGIMRTNVDKVVERGGKLSELDRRAEALRDNAEIFETQAAKLKKKYWWKNTKIWLLLVLSIIILIVVSIGWSRLVGKES